MRYCTDDPVRDAAHYYADLEAHPAKPKCPKCDWCEEEIPESDEWCYEVAGEMFCEKCMRIQFGWKVKSLISYE